MVETRHRVTGGSLAGRLSVACGALLLLASVSPALLSVVPTNIPRPRALSRALSWATGAVASVRNDGNPPVQSPFSAFLASVVTRLAGLAPGNHLVWVDLFALRPADILLAHVFLICRWLAVYYSRHWKTFPGEQRQLAAAQLGMRSWLCLLLLRRMAVVAATNPPVAALIFMLCFASFATDAIAGRRSAGDHYRAGNLSGAELTTILPARQCWR